MLKILLRVGYDAAMNPALGALLLGAACIALSPIFVRLSEAGPDRDRVLARCARRSGPVVLILF